MEVRNWLCLLSLVLLGSILVERVSSAPQFGLYSRKPASDPSLIRPARQTDGGSFVLDQVPADLEGYRNRRRNSTRRLRIRPGFRKDSGKDPEGRKVLDKSSSSTSTTRRPGEPSSNVDVTNGYFNGGAQVPSNLEPLRGFDTSEGVKGTDSPIPTPQLNVYHRNPDGRNTGSSGELLPQDNPSTENGNGSRYTNLHISVDPTPKKGPADSRQSPTFGPEMLRQTGTKMEYSEEATLSPVISNSTESVPEGLDFSTVKSETENITVRLGNRLDLNHTTPNQSEAPWVTQNGKVTGFPSPAGIESAFEPEFNLKIHISHENATIGPSVSRPMVSEPWSTTSSGKSGTQFEAEYETTTTDSTETPLTVTLTPEGLTAFGGSDLVEGTPLKPVRSEAPYEAPYSETGTASDSGSRNRDPKIILGLIASKESAGPGGPTDPPQMYTLEPGPTNPNSEASRVIISTAVAISTTGSPGESSEETENPGTVSEARSPNWEKVDVESDLESSTATFPQRIGVSTIPVTGSSAASGPATSTNPSKGTTLEQSARFELPETDLHGGLGTEAESHVPSIESPATVNLKDEFESKNRADAMSIWNSILSKAVNSQEFLQRFRTTESALTTAYVNKATTESTMLAYPETSATLNPGNEIDHKSTTFEADKTKGIIGTELDGTGKDGRTGFPGSESGSGGSLDVPTTPHAESELQPNLETLTKLGTNRNILSSTETSMQSQNESNDSGMPIPGSTSPTDPTSPATFAVFSQNIKDGPDSAPSLPGTTELPQRETLVQTEVDRDFSEGTPSSIPNDRSMSQNQDTTSSPRIGNTEPVGESTDSRIQAQQAVPISTESTTQIEEVSAESKAKDTDISTISGDQTTTHYSSYRPGPQEIFGSTDSARLDFARTTLSSHKEARAESPVQREEYIRVSTESSASVTYNAEIQNDSSSDPTWTGIEAEASSEFTNQDQSTVSSVDVTLSLRNVLLNELEALPTSAKKDLEIITESTVLTYQETTTTSVPKTYKESAALSTVATPFPTESSTLILSEKVIETESRTENNDAETTLLPTPSTSLNTRTLGVTTESSGTLKTEYAIEGSSIIWTSTPPYPSTFTSTESDLKKASNETVISTLIVTDMDVSVSTESVGYSNKQTPLAEGTTTAQYPDTSYTLSTATGNTDIIRESSFTEIPKTENLPVSTEFATNIEDEDIVTMISTPDEARTENSVNRPSAHRILGSTDSAIFRSGETTILPSIRTEAESGLHGETSVKGSSIPATTSVYQTTDVQLASQKLGTGPVPTDFPSTSFPVNEREAVSTSSVRNDFKFGTMSQENAESKSATPDTPSNLAAQISTESSVLLNYDGPESVNWTKVRSSSEYSTSTEPAEEQKRNQSTGLPLIPISMESSIGTLADGTESSSQLIEDISSMSPNQDTARSPSTSYTAMASTSNPSRAPNRIPAQQEVPNSTESPGMIEELSTRSQNNQTPDILTITSIRSSTEDSETNTVTQEILATTDFARLDFAGTTLSSQADLAFVTEASIPSVSKNIFKAESTTVNSDGKTELEASGTELGSTPEFVNSASVSTTESQTLQSKSITPVLEIATESGILFPTASTSLDSRSMEVATETLQSSSHLPVKISTESAVLLNSDETAPIPATTQVPFSTGSSTLRRENTLANLETTTHGTAGTDILNPMYSSEELSANTGSATQIPNSSNSPFTQEYAEGSTLHTTTEKVLPSTYSTVDNYAQTTGSKSSESEPAYTPNQDRLPEPGHTLSQSTGPADGIDKVDPEWSPSISTGTPTRSPIEVSTETSAADLDGATEANLSPTTAQTGIHRQSSSTRTPKRIPDLQEIQLSTESGSTEIEEVSTESKPKDPDSSTFASTDYSRNEPGTQDIIATTDFPGINFPETATSNSKAAETQFSIEKITPMGVSTELSSTYTSKDESTESPDSTSDEFKTGAAPADFPNKKIQLNDLQALSTPSERKDLEIATESDILTYDETAGNSAVNPFYTKTTVLSQPDPELKKGTTELSTRTGTSATGPATGIDSGQFLEAESTTDENTVFQSTRIDTATRSDMTHAESHNRSKPETFESKSTTPVTVPSWVLQISTESGILLNSDAAAVVTAGSSSVSDQFEDSTYSPSTPNTETEIISQSNGTRAPKILPGIEYIPNYTDSATQFEGGNPERTTITTLQTRIDYSGTKSPATTLILASTDSAILSFSETTLSSPAGTEGESELHGQIPIDVGIEATTEDELQMKSTSGPADLLKNANTENELEAESVSSTRVPLYAEPRTYTRPGGEKMDTPIDLPSVDAGSTSEPSAGILPELGYTTLNSMESTDFQTSASVLDGMSELGTQATAPSTFQGPEVHISTESAVLLNSAETSPLAAISTSRNTRTTQGTTESVSSFRLDNDIEAQPTVFQTSAELDGRMAEDAPSPISGSEDTKGQDSETSPSPISPNSETGSKHNVTRTPKRIPGIQEVSISTESDLRVKQASGSGEYFNGVQNQTTLPLIPMETNEGQATAVGSIQISTESAIFIFGDAAEGMTGKHSESISVLPSPSTFQNEMSVTSTASSGISPVVAGILVSTESIVEIFEESSVTPEKTYTNSGSSTINSRIEFSTEGQKIPTSTPVIENEQLSSQATTDSNETTQITILEPDSVSTSTADNSSSVTTGFLNRTSSEYEPQRKVIIDSELGSTTKEDLVSKESAPKNLGKFLEVTTIGPETISMSPGLQTTMDQSHGEYAESEHEIRSLTTATVPEALTEGGADSIEENFTQAPQLTTTRIPIVIISTESTSPNFVDTMETGTSNTVAGSQNENVSLAGEPASNTALPNPTKNLKTDPMEVAGIQISTESIGAYFGETASSPKSATDSEGSGTILGGSSAGNSRNENDGSNSINPERFPGLVQVPISTESATEYLADTTKVPYFVSEASFEDTTEFRTFLYSNAHQVPDKENVEAEAKVPIPSSSVDTNGAATESSTPRYPETQLEPESGTVPPTKRKFEQTESERSIVGETTVSPALLPEIRNNTDSNWNQTRTPKRIPGIIEIFTSTKSAKAFPTPTAQTSEISITEQDAGTTEDQTQASRATGSEVASTTTTTSVQVQGSLNSETTRAPILEPLSWAPIITTASWLREGQGILVSTESSIAYQERAEPRSSSASTTLTSAGTSKSDSEPIPPEDSTWTQDTMELSTETAKVNFAASANLAETTSNESSSSVSKESTYNSTQQPIVISGIFSANYSETETDKPGINSNIEERPLGHDPDTTPAPTASAIPLSPKFSYAENPEHATRDYNTLEFQNDSRSKMGTPVGSIPGIPEVLISTESSVIALSGPVESPTQNEAGLDSKGSSTLTVLQSEILAFFEDSETVGAANLSLSTSTKIVMEAIEETTTPGHPLVSSTRRQSLNVHHAELPVDSPIWPPDSAVLEGGRDETDTDLSTQNEDTTTIQTTLDPGLSENELDSQGLNGEVGSSPSALYINVGLLLLFTLLCIALFVVWRKHRTRTYVVQV